MTPRLFPLLFALLLAVMPSLGAQSTAIRIMAANTTSGTGQAYEAPGERIFEGLDPDIVLIQEFNVGDNAVATIDAWVDTHFGTDFAWFREPGGDQIPNGIISRWPLLESGQWADPNVSNRDFAYARIDIPGATDLWAVSVHLLTTSSTNRNNQATDLVSAIGAHPVPAGDYLVIGGDLNTNNRSESAITTFSAVVDTSSPYPVDQNANGNTNASRAKPYDWVMPDSDLDVHGVATVIGASSYSNGLVFDSRVYTPLAEVTPVQTGDSGVSGMQHMGVVRDFSIPDTTADFAVAPTAVDFGTVDATAAPFADSSVTITVTNPFNLTGVSFSGADAGEFALTSPDLSSGSVAIGVNSALTFAWTPAGNDGQTRAVTATLTTDAAPADFNVGLAGQTNGSGGSASAEPWINELHYDNVNADTGEFVEIAGPAGTDLTGWSLVGHNGNGGASYDTVALSGTIPSQLDCFGTLAFDFTGLQNGAPDAVALVDDTNAVVEFIGYEGTLTATNGAAMGLTSVDIGVEETNATPIGHSLQLAGDGTQASDFTWQTPAAETRGQPNTGQTFADGCGDTTPPAAPTNLTATGGDGVVNLDWDDNIESDLAGYNLLRSTTSGSGHIQINGPLIVSSEFTDTGVTNGTTYHHMVTAVDSAPVPNESDPSDEIAATPQAPFFTGVSLR